MHSHDRTLLARLGFSDPDKQNPLHDRACAYLSEDAQSRKLVSMVEDGATPSPRGYDWSRYSFATECSIEKARALEKSTGSVYSEARFGGAVAALERPLTKGRGQYATTIGFVDVSLAYWFEGHQVGWNLRSQRPGMPEEKFALDCWETIANGVVIVEVKIAPVPLGDVMRQMNLYAQHAESLWELLPTRQRMVETHVRSRTSRFLATVYPLARTDVALLTRENIRHVRLGDGFKAWLEKPREDDDSPSL